MALPRPVPPYLRLRTPGYAHHGLEFSPYFDGRAAIASGANFGLVGNGRVHVVQTTPAGLQLEKVFDTQDCVYDVAWNEAHENQVLAVCGNGSIRLFDITLQGLPVAAWHEHTAEVVSADWSNIEKTQFVTASWDGSAKVWTTERATALVTLPGPPGSQLYTALFSPHTPALLATSGQDGFVRFWDLRTAMGGAHMQPVQTMQASAADVLAADWNKYHPGVLATAGKDRVVRVWDTRNAGRPVTELGGREGHTSAVRKVQWSPHHADVLASCGYDMSTRVWRTAPPGIMGMMHDHSEFCMALGWALFEEGVLATGGWDQVVNVYRPV
ncbi:hypothetical protein CspeluHIS016_0601860 [Cutaneotrichosporon spelunceum]|uniref:Peroxin-7 n=1 Tax=Cutaneotrichosporon spelunceum TaxID=1672016 RepID=A0AAD3TYA8_9TREE|nr:hypothetical protein CspeluHIS016_0601860 [Cutaneotrichosporon spelunceum]